MEERVAFSAEDPRLQHSRLESYRNDDDDSPRPPLPPPPGHAMSAFVVQVPKNQIYRVPPPENAQIVQNYRQAAAAKKPKRKTPCLKYCLCILLVLFLICLIIGGAILTVFFVFKPKGPVFSVSSLVVKQRNSSPAIYDVQLKIKNPNDKMGIKYTSEEDNMKLSFTNKTLGWGKFPSLKQEKGNTDTVNIKYNGVKDKPVPPDVKTSMNDTKTKTKHQIALSLNIQSPLVFNVWILKLWKKDMDVKCTFRVSTMGEGTKILKRDCHTKLS